MACRYDGPNQLEEESREVAKHLVRLSKFKLIKVDKEIREASKSTFGCRDKIHEFTELLCTTLRNMPENVQEVVIYNGRDPEARKLADWWDKHQEADRKAGR